jgi:hypothetical protein
LSLRSSDLSELDPAGRKGRMYVMQKT